MMLINLCRIVLFFLMFFINFVPLSAANLITITEKQPVSGGFLLVRAQPGCAFEFAGRKVACDSEGYAALPLAREQAGLLELVVWQNESPLGSELIWVYGRKYDIQRINGVDQSRVEPPAEVTERIIREDRLVKAARASKLDLNHWREEDFIWPAPGRISGVYGSQRYYNGIARNPHWGVDMAAPKGTPVIAPAGGVVVLAEADLYFSGGTIVIDHGGGLTSSFLHMSQLHVGRGETVSQGQLIGAVGSTGRSTGPHLDWRMNLHDVRIDAALWAPGQKPE